MCLDADDWVKLVWQMYLEQLCSSHPWEPAGLLASLIFQTKRQSLVVPSCLKTASQKGEYSHLPILGPCFSSKRLEVRILKAQTGSKKGDDSLESEPDGQGQMVAQATFIPPYGTVSWLFLNCLVCFWFYIKKQHTSVFCKLTNNKKLGGCFSDFFYL